MQPTAYEAMRRLQTDHWWWRGMRGVYRLVLARYGMSGGRVLDIGCGFGANLPVLDETAPRLLVGVDVSFEALQHIPHRDRLFLVQARADALPFRADAFDTVVLLAVIEHIERDGVALQESRRVTKKGGIQMLLTSALMMLWSHHDTANGHYRRYRARAIDQLQHQTGWRVLHTTYINQAIFPVVLVVRAIQRRMRPSSADPYDMGPNPPLIRRVLEGLLTLEGWLMMRGVRFPIGVDVISISRRERDSGHPSPPHEQHE